MAIRILTVTVSDTRTPADDTSGAALVEAIRAYQPMPDPRPGMELEHARHEIIPDDPERIRALIQGVVATGEADVLVLSGGTGIGPRDSTYEAVRALLTKELDGFGEAFRRLSWDDIGPRAVLSRATAGLVGRHVVFALPGSTSAARLGIRELVLPIVAHAVALARGDTRH